MIFKYDPDHDIKTKIKDVPEADIIARVEGCWHEQIYYTVGSKSFDKSVSTHYRRLPAKVRLTDLSPLKDKQLVIDLNPLFPAPKLIPPIDNQLPNESRIIWAPVTEAILNKKYSEATTAKQVIEERQREKATDRKARNAEWKPRFFTDALTPPGQPELTKEGWDAIKRMHEDDYTLIPPIETGA